MTGSTSPAAVADYRHWREGNKGFPPATPADPWGVSAAYFAGWAAGRTHLAGEVVTKLGEDNIPPWLEQMLMSGGDDP